VERGICPIAAKEKKRGGEVRRGEGREGKERGR